MIRTFDDIQAFHHHEVADIAGKAYNQMAYQYLRYMAQHLPEVGLGHIPTLSIDLGLEGVGVELRRTSRGVTELQISIKSGQSCLYELDASSSEPWKLTSTMSRPAWLKPKHRVGRSYYMGKLIQAYATVVSLYGQAEDSYLPHCMHNHPSLVADNEGFETFGNLEKRYQEHLQKVSGENRKMANDFMANGFIEQIVGIKPGDKPNNHY